MSHRFGLWPVALLLQLFFVAELLHGQVPQVQYLYPSQAQIGSTVEAEWIGKQLDRIDRSYFSRPGIEAKLLGKGKVALTIATDALPGDCDLWTASAAGSAMPVRLAIGGFPTRTEVEPNNGPADAGDRVAGDRLRSDRSGTDADWYRIRLQVGDGLTLACRSATLGGTLQPTLVVLDPRGREIAHDTLTQLEPTVHVEAAVAGDYAIGVQDRSYRSTPSPFYQLSLTTGPWIVGAYPPSVEKGKSQRVTLYGYRLTAGEPVAAHGPLQRQSVELAAPDILLPAERGWVLSRSLFVDSFEYRPANAGGFVRFELLDRPVQDGAAETPEGRSTDAKKPDTEKPNTGWADAIRARAPLRHRQSVRLPSRCRPLVSLHGPGRTHLLARGGRRTDRSSLRFGIDRSRFRGQAAGNPWQLHDSQGCRRRRAAGQSGSGRVLEGAGRRRLPARRSRPARRHDAVGRTGLSTVGRPALGRRRRRRTAGRRRTPPGWSVRAGGKLAVTLTVVRRGGHQAPIEVRAEGLPAGLSIAPLTIAADKSTAVITIAADKTARPWVGPIRLVATTEANRKPLSTEVRLVSPLTSATPAMARFCDEAVIAIVGPDAK